MVVVIAKSVNLNLLVFILRKRFKDIEYLEPINNILIRNLVKFMESKFNYKFKRVKMGKIKTFENEKLLKIASYKAVKNFTNLRLSINKKSYSPVFDLFNDQIIKRNFINEIAKNLIFIYQKKRTLNFDEQIVLFEEKKTIYFNFFRKLNNLLIIEFFRILVFIAVIFKNIFFKKSENKLKSLNLEALFIASEPYAKTKLEYTLRNQQVLSKNILKNSTYAVIDLLNMKYYNSKINNRIKKGSFLQFLNIFQSNIPSYFNYSETKYNLNLKDFVKSLLIVYKIWSVAKNINAQKYFIDSNSYEGSCLLILGNILKIPCYIFQGSLLAQINPYLHNPYANIVGFTNKHIEDYKNESKGFNSINTHSLKIDYPYLSEFDFKRIANLKRKLQNKFDLSIAFFDENYCRNNLEEHAIGSFFYEELKEELKIILSIANKNPKVALIFKSQFISNTISKLINKDKNLKKLFNPNQIFEIFIKTGYNDRNIITPAEIAQSVDLSISNTMGGTAGFEAATVDCRTIFIKSGLSAYDDLLPANVTINKISELEILIKKIDYSRELLYKTDIGKLDKKFIKNI